MAKPIYISQALADKVVVMAIAAAKMRKAIRDNYISPWRTKIARVAQLAPVGAWLVWLYLAGRGAGKTRSGAEWVHEQIRGGCKRMALVAATAADVRDTMVEGEAGIIATCPDDLQPCHYYPSLRKVTYGNGAELHLYSAEEAYRLRGPSHDGAWADEVCFWKNIDTSLEDLTKASKNPWTMLMFTLRLGDNPQVMVSTTPMPLKWLKTLMKLASTVITTETTYDNIDNLAPQFISTVIKPFEGTRLGEQELMAKILDDIPGALWTAQMLADCRIDVSLVPPLRRISIGVDPAVSDNSTSAETGIMVAGVGPCACKGKLEEHLFFLDDLTIDGPCSANAWATRACRGYAEYQADHIVGEVNNGGYLVETNLRTVDARIAYKSVTASRGKFKRAEPVSMLYERHEVHHVTRHVDGHRVDNLQKFENQLLLMTKDDDYDLIDRADAGVWVATDLMIIPTAIWEAA